MSQAFSDVTGLLPNGPVTHEQAKLLASRLGLPPLTARDYGRWHLVLFAGVEKLLDRVEALERVSERDEISPAIRSDTSFTQRSVGVSQADPNARTARERAEVSRSAVADQNGLPSRG